MSGCWVFQETEKSADGVLCTVGFFRPDGSWCGESDVHGKTRQEAYTKAAERVHYLNGGSVECRNEREE